MLFPIVVHPPEYLTGGNTRLTHNMFYYRMFFLSGPVVNGIGRSRPVAAQNNIGRGRPWPAAGRGRPPAVAKKKIQDLGKKYKKNYV